VEKIWRMVQDILPNKTVSQLNLNLRAGCQWLTPVILTTWEAEIRRIDSRPAQANSSQDPITKKLNTKKAGGMTQVVKQMLCKCEALSSNANPTKKNFFLI
jgi:hypothetical protein